MHKIFIDGMSGTTGLQIRDRLLKKTNIKILEISNELRKDITAKVEFLNNADVSILCLPDEAAIEAVSLAKSDARILDASTAHRTLENWTYGFPELNPLQRQKIMHSNRVSVPGCHASGFIAIMYPLVSHNIVDSNYTAHCFSLTGYSGGGKSMISEYESFDRHTVIPPKMYALNGNHKHIKEMMLISKLNKPPIFNPIVCDYYQGMAVTISFSSADLNGINNSESLQRFYSNIYNFKHSKICVSKYDERGSNGGAMYVDHYKTRDDMMLYINGNDINITVTAVYDNLGKGAAGAAVQCLDLMLENNN
ncbi:MAG: N-acetyl-gamma-glutamyl-phosphate reductase [Christensenellaceae bacterium]|jgi:N-acetyl-gamma-glutamyl-phosphate reductase|nr:N-acetyl-gamma-glutamyl-phosphate reductase [Christensenellaceae bacterium]